MKRLISLMIVLALTLAGFSALADEAAASPGKTWWFS